MKLANKANNLIRDFKSLKYEAFTYINSEETKEKNRKSLWDRRLEPVLVYNELNKVWTEAGNTKHVIGIHENGDPIYPFPLDVNNHFDDSYEEIFDFYEELFLLIENIEELTEKVRKLQ